MEYKFLSWNKNSEVILKKKNLSLVTVTNDKFNLEIILTFFLSSEVRTGFILNPIHGSLMCPLCHTGRVLVSPCMVHSSPVPSYVLP